jgi:hypothetical protein
MLSLELAKTLYADRRRAAEEAIRVAALRAAAAERRREEASAGLLSTRYPKPRASLSPAGPR